MRRLSLEEAKKYAEWLYKKYGAEIFSYVKSRERTMGEDITQEVFCRASSSVYSRREEMINPQAWLYTVAKNLCSEVQRRRKLFPEESLDWSPFGDTGPQEIPDNVSRQPEEVLEREEAFSDAIKALPQGFIQDVIVLHAEGYSYEEIAQQLGLQVDSVKRYASRGRLLLRDVHIVS